jgi:hypothetical protein
LNGESGVLPMLGYVVLGLAQYVWMRRHGITWQVLAQRQRVNI